MLENDKIIPEVLVANPLPQGSYASGTQLNCILYCSGGRHWYATVLPYSVIGTLIQTTQVKRKDTAISSAVVNRFLDAKHVNGLKRYIVDNKGNFTIPPITLVCKTELPFAPITFGLEKFESMSQIYKTVEDLGSMLGRVTIPLGYTFTCLDGNHRSKAIAELAAENPEYIQGNFMLCNIVFETDNLRIRQDFVDINQNAKTTTATINTLFNSRDPLAKLTSKTIEDIKYLNDNTEILAASVSINSKKIYTLNNIKNAIVELGGYNSQSKTSIGSMSAMLDKDPKYLEGIILELDVFFDMLKNNEIVNKFLLAEKTEDKIKIRSQGIISSGVGLIIAARVINYAAEGSKGISYEDIVLRVMKYDWSRSNQFFRGKILSDEGSIISSTNSIKSTANALLAELFPEIR